MNPPKASGPFFYFCSLPAPHFARLLMRLAREEFLMKYLVYMRKVCARQGLELITFYDAYKKQVTPLVLADLGKKRPF